MTDVPCARVVMRGVGWNFYEQLVGSIPEDRHIRVNAWRDERSAPPQAR